MNARRETRIPRRAPSPHRTRTPSRVPSPQRARTPWRAAAIPLVLSACVLAACAEPGRVPAPGEGFVEVEGGRVWYRVVGEGSGTPLVLLHGGPGAPGYYLESLAALGADRPVVFYDQLGAGRSDRPSDTTLWRVDRFVDELARLRAHLGLDEVHILGHSWGTMLAVEYMRTDPEGVRSLVLASPALSVRRWTEDADRLLAALPDSLQEAVDRHEAAGTTGDPEYQAAVMEYYRRYLSLADPWPAELLRTFDEFGSEVYEYMWGPSEFTSTGTLRGFEREAFLPELDLPVLFTAGRHDEATPESVAAYRDLVPGARLEIFENSAHMTMLDEPEAYVEAIRAFLAEVEEGAAP